VTAGSVSRAAQRPVRRRGRPAAAAARRGSEAGAATIARAPSAPDGATLETIGGAWWSALDAADTAARAAAVALAPSEVVGLNARLAAERASTVQLLEAVARDEGVRVGFSNVLVSRSALRNVLGLPSAVTACIFNLDGVLIASAVLHAAAWAETLDEFIHTRVERTGGRFAPFDRRADYRRHFHGRPRLDGVRDFLASRGIALPEGDTSAVPGAETVHGLANRKKLALLRRLDREGVRACDGSRRFLEAARDAGIHRVGLSASANTERIVESAGLAGLIEECVDGNTILACKLRPRPAPDIVLAACDLVGVRPEEAAVFETSTAGVRAARACGVRTVIGVDSGGQAKALLEAGAAVAVTGLAEILDRNLRLLGSRAVAT
jgi:HAD superfamily hydrolase (TIGR01509 family)